MTILFNLAFHFLGIAAIHTEHMNSREEHGRQRPEATSYVMDIKNKNYVRFFLKIYFRKREQAHADSALSTEPDTGLNPMTLRW